MTEQQEIERIVTRYDWEGLKLEEYAVNVDGVTKIDTYSFCPEPYCAVEIVRVWKGDHQHASFVRTNVAAVYYK